MISDIVNVMQYYSSAKSGWHEIDGQRVHTDSIEEAAFIKSLVKHGFSGKWRRTRTGIGSGRAHYTPDLELSIIMGDKSYRGLVEYKSTSAAEFTKADRQRLNGITKHYPNALPFLYVHRTKQWYQIDSDEKLIRIDPLCPGHLSIDTLPQPTFTIPVINRYGRVYQTQPVNLILKKFADILELGIAILFGLKINKKYKRRRK